MKFKALIDGVHFDPKKGAVKIVLIGASHVSLDELTTLSPKDETVQVTLESEQTKIEVISNHGTIEIEESAGLQIRIDEEAAERLKDAAERLREDDEVDVDEAEGGGQGGIA
jgi:hypothetical protein